QQARGGGKYRSPSIKIDRPTLHHNTGMHHRYVQLLPDPGRDHVVLIVRRILVPPGIVTPVYDDLSWLSTRVYQEGGAVIAAPRIIRGVEVKHNVVHVSARLLQP